ncbi:hypothetical protein [Bradyrhizobium sp.]
MTQERDKRNDATEDDGSAPFCPSPCPRSCPFYGIDLYDIDGTLDFFEPSIPTKPRESAYSIHYCDVSQSGNRHAAGILKSPQITPSGAHLPKLQSAAERQSGLVCAMTTGLNDYYVVTSRRGDYPERWSWEIRRKSKPLGIKMTGDGFQSEMAAQIAGKRALVDFLTELSKEEKRK